MNKTKKSVYYRINGVMNYQGLDGKMHPALYYKRSWKYEEDGSSNFLNKEFNLPKVRSNA